MSVSQKGLSLLLRIIKSSDENNCQFIFLPFLLGLYVLIIIIVIIICCYFLYVHLYLSSYFIRGPVCNHLSSPSPLNMNEKLQWPLKMCKECERPHLEPVLFVPSGLLWKHGG